MGYSKPQSPIKIGEEYVYPLTTSDQIINEDGSRGYDILKNVPFLYSMTLLLNRWSGSNTFTQTVSIEKVTGTKDVTSSSKIYSPPMCEQTSNKQTNIVLSRNLAKINAGNIVLGENIATFTVFEKPNSDIEILLQIKE